jgi:hypothetical protein
MSHIELLPEWNVHHIWWPKNQYNTRFEKSFRNATENKIVVPTRNHNFLHAKVQPPTKPTRNQMFELMDILESSTVDEQTERLWALEKAKEYFGALAVEKTYDNYIAESIQENMVRQIGVLTMKVFEGQSK